jgi:hypothetical protein
MLMDAEKLQVKIFFADGGARPALETFIPVFHRWIKEHVLNELLVDVANYAHVPKGPGIALIGHGADYFIDEAEGRRGLLHSRKRETPPAGERLSDAFRRTLRAAALLENEKNLSEPPRFRTDEFLFRINDRLAAGNNEESFVKIRPQLEAFAGKLFGLGAFKLALVGKPKQLFSVRITHTGSAGLRELLERLGG